MEQKAEYENYGNGQMKLAKMKHYRMRPAEQINQAIAELPTAEEYELTGTKMQAEGEDQPETQDAEEIPNFKGIKVTLNDPKNKGKSHFVYMPSKKYQLVQHETAFRPIVEGLTLAGVHDFGFITTSNEKKAQLQIYATGEGYDTVSLGFSVINSFDGSSAISYGFRSFREKAYIEIVGYRQICSNGMKIRVPLDEAEIIKPELRTEVETLLAQHTSILHTKNAEKKIEAMQYIVEAISLLREPVELMIKKAQRWTWRDQEHFNELIKNHVGQRYKAKVEEQMEKESQDLWGLFNAITYVASHDLDIKDTSRETMLNKAAEMLMVEL